MTDRTAAAPLTAEEEATLRTMHPNPSTAMGRVLEALDAARAAPSPDTGALAERMLDYDMLAKVLAETSPVDWPGDHGNEPYDAPHRAWAARIVTNPTYLAALAAREADHG